MRFYLDSYVITQIVIWLSGQLWNVAIESTSMYLAILAPSVYGHDIGYDVINDISVSRKVCAGKSLLRHITSFLFLDALYFYNLLIPPQLHIYTPFSDFDYFSSWQIKD